MRLTLGVIAEWLATFDCSAGEMCSEAVGQAVPDEHGSLQRRRMSKSNRTRGEQIRQA